MSKVPNASGVHGFNTNGGIGVTGGSDDGDGVNGLTNSSAKTGVVGLNQATTPSQSFGGYGVWGISHVPNRSGVNGTNNNGGIGVSGISDNGDGVNGATNSSAKTGVIGRNSAATPGQGLSGNGVLGISSVPNASGVFGTNNNGGIGVSGASDGGDGVNGLTNSSAKTGVVGRNGARTPGQGIGGNGVLGVSSVPNASGVFGTNNNGGIGVSGASNSDTGVFGSSQTGRGVHGNCDPGPGVLGTSKTGAGVSGGSDSLQGVSGFSISDTGVFGSSQTGRGVHGNCDPGPGVLGTSKNNNAFGILAGQDAHFQQHTGVYGESDQQGVFGAGTVAGSTGVYGTTKTGDGFGVRGETTSGTAIQGKTFGSGLAGRFEGNVEVTGDLLLSGADCAEKFRVAAASVAEPGTVMVIQNDGLLQPCSREMDPTVAGVVSGAGSFKAAIVLDYEAGAETVPIALTGKVFVKVDADIASISAGDLLVTSSTLGHAMRLPQNLRDRGATSGLVLGKALSSLCAGRGVIPMLVTLS
jgi:hypothetical protein